MLSVFHVSILLLHLPWNLNPVLTPFLSYPQHMCGPAAPLFRLAFHLVRQAYLPHMEKDLQERELLLLKKLKKKKLLLTSSPSLEFLIPPNNLQRPIFYYSPFTKPRTLHTSILFTSAGDQLPAIAMSSGSSRTLLY